MRNNNGRMELHFWTPAWDVKGILDSPIDPRSCRGILCYIDSTIVRVEEQCCDPIPPRTTEQPYAAIFDCARRCNSSPFVTPPATTSELGGMWPAAGYIRAISLLSRLPWSLAQRVSSKHTNRRVKILSLALSLLLNLLRLACSAHFLAHKDGRELKGLHSRLYHFHKSTIFFSQFLSLLFCSFLSPLLSALEIFHFMPFELGSMPAGRSGGNVGVGS
jgi:hypothetical protein